MNITEKFQLIREEIPKKGKNKVKIRSIVMIGFVVLILVLVFTAIRVVKIEGNEAAVRQGLREGVINEVWLSGTYFYFGWWWDVYVYDIGTKKCTFADAAKAKDSRGVEYSRIQVNLGEEGGQSAWISMSIIYRIGHDVDEAGAPYFSPASLVALHKDGIGKTYQDVVIKRTVIDVINELARPRRALEIYSGEGFVKFNDDIRRTLMEHDVFKKRGILIEEVVVYNVDLNAPYEAEIEAKQLEIQKRLKEVEATKAAQAMAQRVFAEQQAMVEKRTQEAEADKIEKVKAAEANKEQAVLAAEAEKMKRILEAEGERDANIALAEGVLKVGEAEATVAQLKRDAMYSGEAGKRRAEVEIAIAQAERLKGMLEGTKVITDGTMQVLMDSSPSTVGINIPPTKQ